MKRTPARIAATGLVLMLAACSEPVLTIENAWVRTPLPGKPMTAAYLELHNATAADAELVAVEAAGFGAAEIHETRMADGLAQMVHLEAVPIAAGARVEFSPGGLHLMLMRPLRTVERGDTVRLTLGFADGSALATEAIVRDSAPR